MEQWHTIPSFLGYSVSDKGRVRNDDTGRIMTIMRNNNGVCHVGLMKGGIQWRRSLGYLVADSFVSRPDNRMHRDECTQVIHLDGDQLNNEAANLLWRPHWFVVSYNLQMNRGTRFKNARPIIDRDTAFTYASPWEAAIKFGLLEADLVLSIANRTYVYPTFQEFRYLRED